MRHGTGWLVGSMVIASCVPLATPARAVEVVATIVPIHSLAAGVMAGIAEPTLLVKGGASPHNFQLKPSDAKALGRAKIVFWVGPEVESQIAKSLQTVPKSTKVVELLDVEGLRVLEPREGGVWTEHDHDHGHGKGHKAEAHGHDHDEGERDGHAWLDPMNAIVMVEAMAAELAKVDGVNAERYLANAAKVVGDLRSLDSELARDLAPLKGRPFIVLHDAYQYLETRYALDAVGSITVTPDRKPSAKRLAELRRVVRERGAACVFDEPQVQTGLVQTVVEGTSARPGRLDPEGSSTLQPGVRAYFDLMRQNAAALRACLRPAS